MRRTCFSAAALVVAGCFGIDGPGTTPAFRRPEPAGPPVNTTPAATEVASRVDAIGRCIAAANPQAGIDRRSLMFHTIGSPQVEVFHRGTSDIFVTEGLVRQCATDGQLAAVLCTEMGKLVSEREALTPAAVRRPDRTPPMDSGVGRDAGWGTAPDQTRLRELADYDRDRKQRAQAVAPPDPAALARMYLVRAGYHDADLQAAAPILQQAQGTATLERQMTAPPPR
jgi:predicted Zn-dependent protease